MLPFRLAFTTLVCLAAAACAQAPVYDAPAEPAASEASDPWAEIDARALSVGPMLGASAEDIADRLTRPGDTDAEKARAIFRWVAEHIHYDIEQFRASLDGAAITARPAEATLRDRKSVCYGYSDLYARMGRHVGLDVEIVRGYGMGWGSDGVGQLPSENHAWNAVRIDGSWRLLDATWAAGAATAELDYVKRFQDGHFFTAPDDFHQRHKPTHPAWTLLDGDRFEAPLVAFASNDALGVEIASPQIARIRARPGEPVGISVIDDQALTIGAWLGARGAADVMDERARFMTPEERDGLLFYELEFETPGTYKFWTGARPAGEEGPLMIVYEHTIEVRAGA